MKSIVFPCVFCFYLPYIYSVPAHPSMPYLTHIINLFKTRSSFTQFLIHCLLYVWFVYHMKFLIYIYALFSLVEVLFFHLLLLLLCIIIVSHSRLSFFPLRNENLFFWTVSPQICLEETLVCIWSGILRLQIIVTSRVIF